MLHQTLEPDVIRGLGPLADQYTHSKAVAYFEQLKSTNQGLEFCATAIAREDYKEDYVNFLMWQVLEHNINNGYSQLPDNLKSGVRTSILTWLRNHSQRDSITIPPFLLNKASQVYALIFAKEYLTGWTSFIQDVMMAALGENISNAFLPKFGTDMFLRISLAIDSEIVDQTVEPTSEEKSHNQLLKDGMRERCVNEMVNAWYCILTCRDVTEECTSLCLQVIGTYISWIDINLIANDRFMIFIFEYLNPGHSLKVREAACVCLKEISVKGMLPPDKLALIETLWNALESSGVLSALANDEEIDFVIKLSGLVAAMVSTLIFAWNRQAKCTPNGPDDLMRMLGNSIHSKLVACIRFFEHDDDDVSLQCVDLVRDYVDMLKRVLPLDDAKEEIARKLFYAIVKKLKYDVDYCFDTEGEKEAEFQDFLQNLKVVFFNLAMLCPELVLASVCEVLTSTLSNWQETSFSDTEVAVRLLYLLGDTLRTNMSTQFSTDKLKLSPLHGMMDILANSGVSNHPHAAVRLQFFETVSRYDRYFPAAVAMDAQSPVIPITAKAFLDQRGLRSNEAKVRSRCAYLFSKFVKTLGKQLSPFAEEILNEIQGLITLSPVNDVERALSCDDQRFIFELAGILIVNTNLPSEKKAALMTSLLRPLVEGFEPMLLKMKEAVAAEADLPEESKTPRASEMYAMALNNAMSYASRTSKAFNNNQTMVQAGCAQVYVDALNVFLLALDTGAYRSTLHKAFRGYLHQMVICLEDQVLPFVPITIRHLLSNEEPRSLHDFIPVLNQIINKFKKLIEPFLREVFMLVVRAVFKVLSSNNGESASDDDTKTIRRTYFQFLFALVSNGVANVILGQVQPDLELVLSTLVQGAVGCRDATAQKICFSVITKLVEAWGEGSAIPLWDFVTKNVIPACFMVPVSVEFDLTDAQTVLALNESSYLMKAINKKQAGRLDDYLRREYLPSLNVPQEMIEEYCRALQVEDNRGFRTYIKAFFIRAKS